MLLRRTLRSFFVPTRNSWTAVGSFSFRESSSHCLQTERGNFTQTVSRQNERLRINTLTWHGKKSQYCWHQMRWSQLKQKLHESKVFLSFWPLYCCINPHPERLCSMWKRCIWTSLVLRCPTCATERQNRRFNDLCYCSRSKEEGVLTAAGWREHPTPRSAPSQSQHRLLLCSSYQKHPYKT